MEDLLIVAVAESSVNFLPHSFKNPMATSTESFVGLSRSKIRISNGIISSTCNDMEFVNIIEWSDP